MNLFSIITRSALTGLAVLGFASSAVAHHIPQQQFVQSKSDRLLETVIATGHSVRLDPELCKRKEGLFGAAIPSEKALVICVKRHGNDLNELADTIRHETIHLAQFCKARKRGATAALLNPEFIGQYQQVAEQYLHMPTSSYQSERIAGESEARVLAHQLDEYQVAALLRNECR